MIRVLAYGDEGRKMSRKAKQRPKNASRVQRMSSWEKPEAESNFEIWEDAGGEPALPRRSRLQTGFTDFLGKIDPGRLPLLGGGKTGSTEAVAKQLG